MSILLSILLLLAPVKVERGRFNIMKDGKRIGTDEFAVTMKGKNYLFEGRAVFGEVTISSKMELDAQLVPVSYEVGTRDGRLRVNVASPVSEIQTIVGGDT